MNPLRSVVAVLGGIAVVSLVVEPLEFTLVNAVADAPIEDAAGYFAVRNLPGILAAKLVYNSLAAMLGGYMAAKIARRAEIAHGAAAAVLQTAALIWGMTASEFADQTPMWMWVALVVLTGPAMVAGATIRARAGATNV